nr:hypothetical protein Iba_chr08bCG9690 [Ipomoea batatas]
MIFESFLRDLDDNAKVQAFFLAWNIWKRRNELIWSNTIWDPGEVRTAAMCQFATWKQMGASRQRSTDQAANLVTMLYHMSRALSLALGGSFLAIPLFSVLTGPGEDVDMNLCPIKPSWKFFTLAELKTATAGGPWFADGFAVPKLCPKKRTSIDHFEPIDAKALMIPHGFLVRRQVERPDAAELRSEAHDGFPINPGLDFGLDVGGEPGDLVGPNTASQERG